MKITAKYRAQLGKLQIAYPFKLPLTEYCQGVNGKPEAREQKAFIKCLIAEFPDVIGRDEVEVKEKNKNTGEIEIYLREFYRALIVSTADFFDKTGGRAMEKYLHMGYQVGTPDIMILVKHPQYSGLVLEMKSLTGRPTKAQKKTLDFLQKQGFSCHVPKGFPAALQIWIDYLKGIELFNIPTC